MFTDFKERDIETLIDNELKFLKWNDNPKDLNCNIFKQRAKIKEQEKNLQGKRPDYILYQKDSDEVLAIIEAKRPYQNIYKAQEQGIEYAKMINAPIVFSTDGVYTKTYHIKKQKPLFLNGEEIDELQSQDILMHYLEDNVYNTQSKKVIKSRSELISIFKNINNLFRDGGLRAGEQRINLMTNMIFLKVISELGEMQDKTIKIPRKEYLWNSFKDKKELDLLDFLNKQAYDYFKDSYGGEVLSKIENINSGKEWILNEIIKMLDNLQLSDVNTDIKGDAFEFFLRNYGGAETDFGEYFTPRHIVKIMVKLLNPRYGEKVYDPFCGTGGMLIESFKHIKRRMPRNDETEKNLKENTVFGGELTTMNRVAKMNMILAGDGHSNIKHIDSYEHRQENKYDVVITNIPFGSKMKTKYLNQYGYNGNSAEICGVVHCLDALNNSENARAGIIIPEGILFKNNKLYSSLRRNLVEKYDIEKIISLPSGVFADTGVKSDILIIKKKSNKQKTHLWYFDVKNDGFTLDKARKKIEGNNDFDILKSENDLSIDNLERLKKFGFKIIYKEELRKNNYILLPNQYEILESKNNYKIVKLGDYFDFLQKSKRPASYGKEIGNYPFFTSSPIQKKWVDDADYNQEALIIGDGGKSSIHIAYKFSASDHNFIITSKDKNVILNKFVFYYLKNNMQVIQDGLKGMALENVSKSHIEKIKIPLFSLEYQQKIVDEIESCENIIQGVKHAVKSYIPQFNINKDWKQVKLGDVFTILVGGDLPKDFSAKKTNIYNIPIYANGIDKKGLQGYTKVAKISKPCITISARGTIGASFLRTKPFTPIIRLLCLIPLSNINLKYFYYASKQIIYKSSGTTTQQLTKPMLESIEIPLPPLEDQQKIVDEIEAEEKNIKACKELIKQMEKKIKNKIDNLLN